MTEKGVRLGKTVLARREALGRTRADVQMLSRRGDEKGISQEALRAIERGTRETIHAGTARGLERGLDWPTGHVDRIMAGEDVELPAEPVQTSGVGHQDELTARLARLEAALGYAESPKLSDREAMVVLLGWLTDDQYRTVADAVTADKRFQSTAT